MENETQQLDEDRKMLRAIHAALIGDGLGNPGLVNRVITMEAAIMTKANQTEVSAIAKTVEGHDRKLWFGLTALSAAWAVIVAFKERIFGH